MSVNQESKYKNRPIILNLPSVGNPFYIEILRGVRIAAEIHGFDLLIHEEEINVESVNSFSSLLQNIKASGLITTNYVNPNILLKLNTVVLVVQCCECDQNLQLPFVTINDTKAARTAVEYIISTGRKRIAFVNGPPQYKYAKKRLEGYQLALKAHNIPVDNSLVIHLPDINFDMAVSAVTTMLESAILPDAIFASSDVFAAGALKAVKRAGLKVPKDIVIIGFDNVDISLMTNPTITTVNQPRYQIGYNSCEILTEIIKNPDAPVRQMVMEVELIIRESSSPAASVIKPKQSIMY